MMPWNFQFLANCVSLENTRIQEVIYVFPVKLVPIVMLTAQCSALPVQQTVLLLSKEEKSAHHVVTMHTALCTAKHLHLCHLLIKQAIRQQKCQYGGRLRAEFKDTVWNRIA
jgi:hypothetical protein